MFASGGMGGAGGLLGRPPGGPGGGLTHSADLSDEIVFGRSTTKQWWPAWQNTLRINKLNAIMASIAMVISTLTHYLCHCYLVTAINIVQTATQIRRPHH